MGILGLKLKARTRRVVVGFTEDGEEVALTLRAPRLGEVDGLEALFPEPTAPLLKDSSGRNQVARNDRGKVQTDENGSPIVLRNKEDAAYLAKINRRGQAMTISMVVSCLGDQISPTRTLEEFKGDRVEYFHAVWAELENEGLDVGCFRALVEASLVLGAPMSKEEVEDARKALGSDDATQKDVKDSLKAEAEAAGKKVQVPAGK